VALLSRRLLSTCSTFPSASGVPLNRLDHVIIYPRRPSSSMPPVRAFLAGKLAAVYDIDDLPRDFQNVIYSDPCPGTVLFPSLLLSAELAADAASARPLAVGPSLWRVHDRNGRRRDAL